MNLPDAAWCNSSAVKFSGAGRVSTNRDEREMLERDRELAVLDGAVTAALRGDPVLALMEGPAGIGKSRLLAATRQKAASAGFRVLMARGSDLERELPFGVVRQLFEPALADAQARSGLLSGSAAAADRVFEPPGDGAGSGDASFAVLYGLFWLTANLAAERPLALAIDDLHWCDPASLRFLVYLMHRLEGLGVLLAATLRTSQRHADAPLLAEIAGDPATASVRPQPLSEPAVGELVRELLQGDPEPEFAAACFRATGGNPLLLGELLTTLRSEGLRPETVHAEMVRDVGPRAISSMVLLRLARLPTDAVAVARAVAVLGDGAALPATAILAELDEARVAQAMRALVQADILRPEPPLGFAHPLVRDAVYHELSPTQRELQHERAARALTDLGAAPELVAAHLLVVPSRADPRVVTTLRQAGSAAERRGDPASSVSYLRRALAEPPPAADRPALLLELGWAEAGEDAAAAAEHMSEAYDQLTDPAARSLAARVLTRMLLFTRSAQEAATVARRALIELPTSLTDQRRSLEAFELYAVAFGATMPADAQERLARVRKDGLQDGLGARILGAVAAWDLAVSNGGSADECSRLALDVLEDGTLIAADPGFGTVIAGGALLLAERDETVGVWDAAMREANRLGSPRTVCIVNVWQGFTWLARGELAEAESSLREALAQVPQIEENGTGLAYIVGLLAQTLRERGDPRAARALLNNGVRAAPRSDGDGLIRRSVIELQLDDGDFEGALRASDEYRSRLVRGDNPAWTPWRSLKAIALDGLGRGDEAIALLEQEHELARRWGAPGALGRTLRLLGTVRADDGLDLMREAARITGESPARLEHAKALVALGSALVRARRRSDGREHLRAGLELAGRCGAVALAEHARTELYAAGGRPRREALSGPASLTPSERRVADLAAEGQSNRDIAQALYVTPKTVEVHLTSIYRRLGISGRAELARALTTSG